jgi:hypothetical protein
MASVSREEQLRAHAGVTVQRLHQISEALARRQASDGPLRGNVPPWPRSDDADLHGTLAAIWIWARTATLADADLFGAQRSAAWAFVNHVWPRFIPTALGPASGDEAAYDCAMVLRAALADRAGAGGPQVRGLPEAAARLLGAHLHDLDDVGGRDFHDPGFLAWSLAEYGRGVGDRGLLGAARSFVDRAFGMKAPPPFASEPAVSDALFDFSSTTATRILAVLTAEGGTPFTGAWLRERVGPSVPAAFVPRPLDENCWNACVAAALGRAYVVGTDPLFLRAHETLIGELESRLGPDSGMLGRQPGFEDETAATFYYALALDSLLAG